MNDEQLFLANAYVDGELTDDERRIADTDPDVMAEVDRLRALRFELRDVPEPSPDVREAAIAAALAEFGVGGNAVTTDAATDAGEPTVVPFRPRPAYAKYLAAAAALVAVAGLGIVLTQIRGNGDDDSSGDAQSAVAETLARQDESVAADAAGAAAEESTTEAADAAEMTAEDTTENLAAAPSMDAEDDAAEMVAEEAAEEAMDDEAASAEPPFGGDADARLVVPPDFDPEAPILNEVELAIYGSYLLDEIDRGTLGPTPETQCLGNYDILDTAVYLLDGDDRTVYIGVNELEGFVVALDTDTCIELAAGSLF